ncbi:MAG: thermonuclease family protein [Elusimicrobia bacterium]|nr:thermonuclease family protein [Elusimicrobiota bacterium]
MKPFLAIIAVFASAAFSHTAPLEYLAAQEENSFFRRVSDESPAGRPSAIGAVKRPAALVIKRVTLDKNRIKFDDGDTIDYSFDIADHVVNKDGEPYRGELRLMGFDTPETLHPHHGIFYDQPYGPEASALTKKLIVEGRVIEIVTANSFDKYGRLLSHLIIDGQQLGVLQIKAGLAYPTFLKYPDDYKLFPGLLIDSQDAWANHSSINLAITYGYQPDFIDPGVWRKQNQQKDIIVTLEQWRSMTQEQRNALAAQAREKSVTPQ